MAQFPLLSFLIVTTKVLAIDFSSKILPLPALELVLALILLGFFGGQLASWSAH